MTHARRVGAVASKGRGLRRGRAQADACDRWAESVTVPVMGDDDGRSQMRSPALHAARRHAENAVAVSGGTTALTASNGG
jgi:hypothetical protein